MVHFMEKNTFDLQAFLAYSLNQAAEEVSLGFKTIYKERYGMLRTEWRVLFHLGTYGSLTAKNICNRSKIHKTKVSRAVSALASRNYLMREELESDRRHELLSLTVQGRRVFEDLRDMAQQYDAEVTSQFTAEELETLHRCLRRLAKF
jgi:DNA-binding MarR family transcriptional regulator